jgi:hypothetical protein
MAVGEQIRKMMINMLGVCKTSYECTNGSNKMMQMWVKGKQAGVDKINI